MLTGKIIPLKLFCKINKFGLELMQDELQGINCMAEGDGFI